MIGLDTNVLVRYLTQDDPEQSLRAHLHAQILVPLIISTSFGLMASTTKVLLVIPCMYMILGDLGIVKKIRSSGGTKNYVSNKKFD